MLIQGNTVHPNKFATGLVYFYHYLNHSLLSNLQFKDPWKMLDPHDPGTAQEKPFKKGQLSLSHNCQGSLIKCWGGGGDNLR